MLAEEILDKIIEDCGEKLCIVLGQITCGGDALQKVGVLDLEVLKQSRLKQSNLVYGDIVEMPVDNSIQNRNLQLDSHGRTLILLEHFYDAVAEGETCLGVGVEIGAELCKRLELSVLLIQQF